MATALSRAVVTVSVAVSIDIVFFVPENSRGGKYVLRTETFEVVEADETFLDLPIENWEVILPLWSPSSDSKSPLRLDRDTFDKEGVGQDVCYMLDKEVFAALFPQMADSWERVSHRYCWLWGGKTQYNWWCWVFKMLLSLVSTLVPI